MSFFDSSIPANRLANPGSDIKQTSNSIPGTANTLANRLAKPGSVIKQTSNSIPSPAVKLNFMNVNKRRGGANNGEEKEGEREGEGEEGEGEGEGEEENAPQTPRASNILNQMSSNASSSAIQPQLPPTTPVFRRSYAIRSNSPASASASVRLFPGENGPIGGRRKSHRKSHKKSRKNHKKSHKKSRKNHKKSHKKSHKKTNKKSHKKSRRHRRNH